MTVKPEEWLEAQNEELSFWGDCSDTYGEETKQFVYMRKMGFHTAPNWRSPVSFDGRGKSYIDIGGGPCSVLLKFTNTKLRAVIDPCPYPDWVSHRYASCKIVHVRAPGEALNQEIVNTLFGKPFDVAFIYNVLQHVTNPETIIKNAIKAAKELHMFEWIDIPPHPGHPHMLTAENLEKWTGLKGHTENLNENGCVGRAWYV
jgi:hypothetical protein